VGLLFSFSFFVLVLETGLWEGPFVARGLMALRSPRRRVLRDGSASRPPHGNHQGFV